MSTSTAMQLEPIPLKCATCDGRKFGLCKALNVPELLLLSKHTRQKHLKKGDTLIFDSDAVTEFANIVSGTAKLSKILNDGRQQIIGLQFAPEFVGRPFTHEAKLTVEAATDMHICILPKTAFEDMLDDAPVFERQLLDQIMLQLDEARDWMVTLGRKTAAEKVASFLLLLANHIGKRDANDRMRFAIPITRADMADFLGLTLETVSRQMTKLRKQSVIELDDSKHVIIPHMTRLQDATGE